MKIEIIFIVLLTVSIIFFIGSMETLFITILPFLLTNSTENLATEIQSNLSNSSSTTTIKENNERYINNVMAYLITVKQITRLVMGFVVGNFLNKFGYKKLIFSGLVIEFVSLLIYSFAFTNILMHLVCRFCDGVAAIMLACSSYTWTWLIFKPIKKDRIFISILNVAFAIGLAVAPFISGALNKSLGYIYIAFYGFLLLIVLTILLILVVFINKCEFVKSDLNLTQNQNSSKILSEFGKSSQISDPDNDKDKCDSNLLSTQTNTSLDIIESDCEINNSINNKYQITQFDHGENNGICREIKLNEDLSVEEKSDYVENKLDCKRRLIIGLKFLIDPYIIISCTGICISNASVSIFASSLPLWMLEKFNCNEIQAGIVWVPSFIVLIISTIILSTIFQKFGSYRWLAPIMGTCLQGIGCLCLPFYKEYWYVAFTIAFGFFSIAANEYVLFPMNFELITTRYSEKMIGQGSSHNSISVSIGSVLGGLFTGPMINLIGFDNFYISVGILTLLITPFNIFLRRYC